MNTEGVGLPIFKIIKKDKGGKEHETLYYVSDDKSVKHPLEEVTTKDGETLQLIPCKKRERSCLYITGSSGAGKSYFCNKYIEQYHKMYPKREIYLFSFFTEDKSLDKLKYIKRVKLDDNFIKTDLSIDDFKNSCIIIDDCDFIKNKIIKTKIFNILDNLLQGGRHSNTEIIYTSHASCNGKDTKIILGECHSVTVFPRIMGNKNLKYLLGEYFGLDNKQINRVKNLESRAVTITRTYPVLVIYEGGAFKINSIVN